MPSKRVPFARERLTVSTSAVPLTATVYDGDPTVVPRREFAAAAEVEVLTNGIIFTRQGATPSASVGQPLSVGDVVTLDTHVEIAGFRAVRDGGADGAIEVIYFR